MLRDCWIHDWSKWGAVYEVSIENQDIYDERTGSYRTVPLEKPYFDDRQRRTCNRCGKVDERTV